MTRPWRHLLTEEGDLSGRGVSQSEDPQGRRLSRAEFSSGAAARERCLAITATAAAPAET